MDAANTKYRVRCCSKCPKDAVYLCVSCQYNICPQCKENHAKNLLTIDHNVVIYSEKFNGISEQDIYVRDPSAVRTSYEPKEEHGGSIHTIRSEALFYRPALLTGIKTDSKTVRKVFSLYESEMLRRTRKLKDLIEYGLRGVDFKHRCLYEKKKMKRNIASTQRYEYIYEQFAIRPLQFLLTIKSTHLHKIHLSPHTSQLSMTDSLCKKDVIQSLTRIKITERGKRRVENERLLKLMLSPDLHESLSVTDVRGCYHISCVTSDRVWVSDNKKNLIMTNTTGDTLHHIEDILSDVFCGLHTVNCKGELIYIDNKNRIKKLSKNLKISHTLFEIPNFPWRLRCVNCSLSNGDLLVGLCREGTETSKVSRYNESGQLTQTLQHDDTGLELFSEPNYITENNNGDVVVSDYRLSSGAVVVTNREGRHRFSYKGHPPGSVLVPRGTCTDALSHILVCDNVTVTVQILDKDGQFLSHLLIRPSGVFLPHGLSYNVNTHRLWVGSYNNMICVYRYITQEDTLTATANLMGPLSEIPTAEIENQQQENQCLLNLMSSPELLHSLTVTDVYGCYHISCVTANRIWVSDKANNLILTNTEGETLNHLNDLCSDLKIGNGLHTVNSEGELIYIEFNYNINKLSKDMKTTTTILERTDSSWKPRCVYMSPSNGYLLVGMYRENKETGKVSRYNQSGQLTKTIQHDSTGLKLYRYPIYITDNNNGDILVSDINAVVVTDRGGRHRFSYTGHPSGSVLVPLGICTDSMSHILVCDYMTDTVQLIDKDGQFLSHLLTKSEDMGKPSCLSYDVNTFSLWVGSWGNNKVYVYKYITQQETLIDDEHPQLPDGFPFFCS